MDKKINADASHVESSPEHQKSGSPVQRRSAGSAEKAVDHIPPAQQETRSDQEQVGTQNPAGDTRDVNREPVEQVEHSPKK